MELQAGYPIVVTNKLADCRDFYTRHLGFRMVFQATWFVYMVSAGDNPHGSRSCPQTILLSRPALRHLTDKECS